MTAVRLHFTQDPRGTATCRHQQRPLPGRQEQQLSSLYIWEILIAGY